MSLYLSFFQTEFQVVIHIKAREGQKEKRANQRQLRIEETGSGI